MDEPKPTTSEVPTLINWGFILLFLATITIPPVLRNLEATAKEDGWVPVQELINLDSPETRSHLASKRSSDPDIVRTEPNFIDHREAWESRLEDADFTNGPRRLMQYVLSSTLHEGNRKVVVGKRDGWLFFRPAIDAITGRGPLVDEPDSVAQDPTRAPWRGPREAIPEFAAQLAETDTQLLLVPIPTKPMILPDLLDDGPPPEGPIRHPDTAAFYKLLEDAGVHVLDPADHLFALRSGQDSIFLGEDTHWTPEAMKEVAALVADRIRTLIEINPTLKFQTNTLAKSNVGDLAERLELPFQRSVEVQIEEVFLEDGKPLNLTDEASPVVLLGDSFTNIYRSETLGWGQHASFAHHLSKHLEISLDVIAQNGQASTGVRKTLAGRPGSRRLMQNSKRIVVWALAARDLFLSRTVAQETGVVWDRVEFNDAEIQTHTPVPAANTVDAELTHMSPLQNPDEVSYADCIIVTKYRILETDEEILVHQWMFQNRKLSPAARFQVGERHRLTLAPWTEQEDLQSITRSSDVADDFLFTPHWAENVEKLP